MPEGRRRPRSQARRNRKKLIEALTLQGLKDFGLNPTFSIPPADYLVFRAWQMMKGIDWSALPLVMELLGIDDPEWFVNSLIVVRDHLDKQTHD